LHRLEALQGRLAKLNARTELAAEVVELGAWVGYPLRLGEGPPGGTASTGYPIGVGRTVYAYLVVARDPASIDPDEHTLLQLLCDILAPRLATLGSEAELASADMPAKRRVST
jgi:hypothetical protein